MLWEMHRPHKQHQLFGFGLDLSSLSSACITQVISVDDKKMNC